MDAGLNQLRDEVVEKLTDEYEIDLDEQWDKGWKKKEKYFPAS